MPESKFENVDYGTNIEKALVEVWNDIGSMMVKQKKTLETSRTQILETIENIKFRTTILIGINILLDKEFDPKTDKIEWIGYDKHPCSKTWNLYGGHRSEAKTDFIIGGHRVSLKAADNVRLVTGGPDELNSIFMSVASNIKGGLWSGKEIKEIYNEIKNLLGSLKSGVIACNNVRDATGKCKEIIDKQKKIQKVITGMITDLFVTSGDLKYLFVHECFTGAIKFDNTKYTADHLMVISDTRVSYDPLDKKLIDSMLSHINVGFNYKSDSVKVGGHRSEDYRYRTILAAFLSFKKMKDEQDKEDEEKAKKNMKHMNEAMHNAPYVPSSEEKAEAQKVLNLISGAEERLNNLAEILVFLDGEVEVDIANNNIFGTRRVAKAKPERMSKMKEKAV